MKIPTGLLSVRALFLISILMAIGSASRVPGQAQGQETLGATSRILREAEQAYAQSDWPEAIALYNSLVDRGVADAAVYYNLGTAYAQAGDSGRAIWMLLRARRLTPRDSEIRDNLDIIAARHAPDLWAQIAIFPIPPVQAVYELLTMNEWALSALTLTIAAGVLGALFFRLGRASPRRSLAKRLALGVGVLAVICHNFAGFKYYEQAYTSRGVIVSAQTNPRAAPNEGADTYDFIIPPGTVIRVGNAGVEGWVKAIYGGNNAVFVLRSQVEYF